MVNYLAIDKYLFETGTPGFWIAFGAWLAAGFAVSIGGMRFANKNGYTVLKFVYAVLLIIGFGLLVLVGGLSNVGAPVA